MRKTEVNIGVIGCGEIGQFHMRAVTGHPCGRLAAVADIRSEAARAAAAEHRVSRVYDSADALLADPQIDGVILAMPAGMRAGVGVRAFTAGKHVLIEKPAAMSTAELKRLVEAQGQALVGACCSSRFRCYPSAQVASEVAGSGALGKVRLVRFRGVLTAPAPPAEMPAPWRLSRRLNGGGILVNWGVYDLDYLLGILGWSLRPKIALAQAWPTPDTYVARHIAPGSDAEAHVIALVSCEDGAAISIERGEFLAGPSDNAWEIIGDRGALCLNMLWGEKTQMLYETTADHGTVARALWSGTEDVKAIHFGPARDFIDSIADSRPPLTSLRDALLVQRIIDAVYASADAGCAVDITA